jgi:signal transduction histidine kinase
MRLAAIALLSLAVGSGISSAQTPQAPATREPSQFELTVKEAKSKMMADPAAAYGLALEAERLANADGPLSVSRAAEAATASWLKGEALNRLNRGAEAVPILEAGLAIAREQASDKKIYGDLMIARAGAARTAGDYALALSYYEAAQELFARLKEDRSQALALQQVGSIYTDARDYAKALQFYERAGATFAGDASVNLARLNNMAHAQRMMGEYDEAEAGLRQALAIAVEMQSPLLQSRILANLASVQLDAGRLDEADSTAREGLALSANREPLGWEKFLWGVRAQVAYARGEAARAAELIGLTFQGQDIAQTPMPYREFHESAEEIFSALGQSGLALSHLKAFKRLDDSVRDVSAAANTALMGAQFDFASQELSIARLKTETLEKQIALGEVQARQATVTLLSVLAFALIAFGATMFHYNTIRRSRNAVRKVNAELSETNTALAKALRAKSEFLATTSHEIRTPLNGILGMTQLLMRRKDLNADIRERVELVHVSGEAMKAIVDDILDIAKLESGASAAEIAEFDLQGTLASISQVWRDSAEKKGIALLCDIEPDLGPIEGDERRIRQILSNLLANAVKFTDAGEVRMNARIERGADKSMLVVDITDTGCGIPAEQLEAIFEPFHQVDGGTARKHGGTGLGLSICRQLARTMAGDVIASSMPGTGSIFTLSLPVVATVVEAARSQGSDVVNKVVVIDGNPLRQSILQALLEGVGRQVVAADDLATGLQATRDGPMEAVMVFANVLGEGIGDVATNSIALREAAGEARLVVCLEPDSRIEQPMLRLSGVDEILAGPFDPLATLAALLPAACPPTAVAPVYVSESNAA